MQYGSCDSTPPLSVCPYHGRPHSESSRGLNSIEQTTKLSPSVSHRGLSTVFVPICQVGPGPNETFFPTCRQYRVWLKSWPLVGDSAGPQPNLSSTKQASTSAQPLTRVFCPALCKNVSLLPFITFMLRAHFAESLQTDSPPPSPAGCSVCRRRRRRRRHCVVERHFPRGRRHRMRVTPLKKQGHQNSKAP